jgi:hypothetical protein
MLQVAIWMQCKNWRRRRDKEVRDIMNPISSTTSRHIKWSTCDLRCWVTEAFSWCPTFCLMEGVSSMSPEDRQEYSKAFGILPYFSLPSASALVV